jgi:hypothetical protein
VNRWLVLLPLGVAVAGVVLVIVEPTLLGALLIIGGVMALGATMIPASVDRIAGWLSGAPLVRRRR